LIKSSKTIIVVGWICWIAKPWRGVCAIIIFHDHFPHFIMGMNESWDKQIFIMVLVRSSLLIFDD
jgi:hypothetical protein